MVTTGATPSVTAGRVPIGDPSQQMEPLTPIDHDSPQLDDGFDTLVERLAVEESSAGSPHNGHRRRSQCCARPVSSGHDGLVPTRLIAIVMGALMVLAGCQLNVEVDVVVEADGSGTIEVTATADAEMVARLPELADQLIFDDLTEWSANGPTPTDDGELVVTLSSVFATPQQLSERLGEIGEPLSAMSAGQATDVEAGLTTTAIAGRLQLPENFEAFADDELIALVGGVPFERELAGLTPSDALRFELRVALPGEMIDANGRQIAPGVFSWVAPTDASAIDISASTLLRDSEPPGWARPVATLALLGLIIWLVLSALFIGFVINARRRRIQQRRRNRQARRGPPRPSTGSPQRTETGP